MGNADILGHPSDGVSGEAERDVWDMVNVKTKNIIASFSVLIILALLPLVLQQSRYYMNILTLCLIWSVVAASWDLIIGYAFVFSFGHLSFFMIGGYTSGLLAKYLNISVWLGWLIGGIANALLGVLIGLPCLRLKGMYLAIVTFSLQFALPVFLVWAGPGRFENFSTGGTWGLVDIPAPQLFGYMFNRDFPVPYYYLTLAFFIIFVLLIYLIIASPIGLAFIALRDSEPLAKSLGVDEYKYKLLVFAISAGIAGIAGAYYASYFGVISPASISLDAFLIVLLMVMLGGMGVFPGAILGAFTITILNEILRPTSNWRLILLGSFVIVVMTVLPKGIMDLPGFARRLYFNLKIKI